MSTRPLITRTGIVGVQPTSAPIASPVESEMIQLCRGQATLSP